MKKLEHILYALTLMILLLVIVIKSFLWSWAGPFLIVTYSVLSWAYMGLSWRIYTVKPEQQKRFYFLYGTIPLGFAISSVLIMALAKLQHWSWSGSTHIVSLFLLFVCELIFIIAYILAKNVIKKEYLKQMVFKTLAFIVVTIAFVCIDFDWVISAMSSKEVNERRELRKIESREADSLYQMGQNR